MTAFVLSCFVDDETQEEPHKLSDVWNYFEQDGKKVRCVVCRHVLEDASYDSLKEHLFDQHPKLLLQLVQEEDQDTKSNPSDHEDNTYTEIVYLEQDSPSEGTTRNSETPKITSTYKKKRPQKRIRISSSTDHRMIEVKKDSELPQKEKVEKPDEDSELDTFIKYIRCLLKKLPPDAFSKVQIDILKTIMDAQYSNKIPNINETSISAPNTAGPSILTDVASCSGSNVTRVNEIVPRKDALVAPNPIEPSILTDVASCSGSNIIRVNEIVPRKGVLVGNYISLVPAADDLDTKDK